MRKLATIFSFFVFSVALMPGQEVQKVSAVLDSDKVIVYYDLMGSDTKYNIDIYSSYDAFARPLRYVNGDVGISVSPGYNKKIIWDYDKEGLYDTDISFIVRSGRTTTSPYQSLRTAAIMASSDMTKGRQYTITWNVKEVSQNVKIELLRNGTVYLTLTSLYPNNGMFTWTVPSEITRNTYQIKITNVNDPNDFCVSSTVSIKGLGSGFLDVIDMIE